MALILTPKAATEPRNIATMKKIDLSGERDIVIAIFDDRIRD